MPDVLARPEIDPAEAVERLLSGYAKLAADLAAADPDVIPVTADCHFQSFETGHFVIGDADSHAGSMEFFKRPDPDLHLTGKPDFARARPTPRGPEASRSRWRPASTSTTGSSSRCGSCCPGPICP
ncbi:hypothetical protein [Nocardioides sp. B-3]|uniref:hypothetical protein n=1 Tax=Nocardioides sp. B-3 TaxID=2895565 RepID=UPI0021532471|nr:hypothetical protein [Nocardioides sp. B-3]UUZ59489.1 hypothetical protein LP418_27560 [Nocardioides sp. B-3]